MDQLRLLSEQIVSLRRDVGLLKRLEYTQGGLSPAGCTLQQAYEGGETIELSAGEGDLRFYNDAAAEMFFGDESSGFIGIGNSAPGNKLSVYTPSTADALADALIAVSTKSQKALVLQGAATQAEDLFQVQNSAGGLLASIDEYGRIYTKGGNNAGLTTAAAYLSSGVASPVTDYVWWPRIGDLTHNVFYDFQDELAYCHKWADSITISTAPGAGALNNIFIDNADYAQWAAALSINPLVITIDCHTNYIPVRSSASWRLGLTMRSASAATNPSHIKLEACSDNDGVYEDTLVDADVTWNAQWEAYLSIQAATTTPYNIYYLKLTLTTTDPLPAILRIQRFMLYHGTHTWDPWHLHVGGGTMWGNITMGDACNIVVNATTGTKIGTATTQKLGFFNATPIVQRGAYTQTYSTADKTVAAIAASAVAVTGTAEDGTARTQVNNLVSDVTDLKQAVNAIIDDLQALGFAG